MSRFLSGLSEYLFKSRSSLPDARLNEPKALFPALLYISGGTCKSPILHSPYIALAAKIFYIKQIPGKTVASRRLPSAIRDFDFFFIDSNFLSRPSRQGIPRPSGFQAASARCQLANPRHFGAEFIEHARFKLAEMYFRFIFSLCPLNTLPSIFIRPLPPVLVFTIFKAFSVSSPWLKAFARFHHCFSAPAALRFCRQAHLLLPLAKLFAFLNFIGIGQILFLPVFYNPAHI